ncbi:MAG TPA: class I adenylate-forming enzyme family protein, partial [Acidimicrobiales bacterium]|nr:class I adenylate-forming enzyme family protein [Acidimicrobiales bacterium]
MLMDEHLGRMAEQFGDETAFAVVDVGAMTFAEWDGAANAMARWLLEAGLEPGGRVGIHLRPELALRWLVSYSAAHRAGGVAVPMNPRLAPAEVGHVLAHSGATAVVTDGDLVPADLQAAEGRLVALVDAGAEAGPGSASGTPVLGWSEATGGDRSPFQAPRQNDDLADILYTSGTTGRPKGVAVRHSNGSMIGAVDPNWTGDGWVHASPLFTFAGIALVYTPMKLGLQVVYQPRFDAGRWLEVVQAERPVAVFLVPAMAHLLIDHPGFDEADLSSVTMCSVGSAPLAPYVVERLQAKMPDALVSNNYGMTEAGSAYCIMPQGEAVKRPGSVGQIAPPAVVQIVDEHDRPLPADEVGEVRLQMPGRHREYYNDPEATAEVWRDGWLVTGDLGKLDADGYLYIVGRSKDVIIRGGNNVHATDVEHALVQHAAVKEVAVVGAPHPVL